MTQTRVVRVKKYCVLAASILNSGIHAAIDEQRHSAAIEGMTALPGIAAMVPLVTICRYRGPPTVC